MILQNQKQGSRYMYMYIVHADLDDVEMLNMHASLWPEFTKEVWIQTMFYHLSQ